MGNGGRKVVKDGQLVIVLHGDEDLDSMMNGFMIHDDQSQRCLLQSK